MRRASLALTALLLVLAVSSSVGAQTSNADRIDHFTLGRDALAAHDPTSAITHLEQVDTRQAAEWLAVALMMESRAASDQFVERAFASATRARIGATAQPLPRKDIVAAIRPGDMVIALLIGEAYSYAWAFDRDGFVGYQLPAPADLLAAADRARAYADQRDQEGLQRISDELLPALLGPAADRLPQLKRVVFVLDGPLQGLPIGALPMGDGGTPLEERVEVAATEFSSLIEILNREQTGPVVHHTDASAYVWWIGGAVLVILLLGGATVLKRR